MKAFRFILLIIVLFLIGCNQEQKVKSNEPIKIGVVIPETGEIASYGKWTKDGIDLAVKETNIQRQKMDKQRFEIIYKDSHSNPNDAVSSLRSLISFNSVKCVIGELASGFTLKMAPIAEANKTVLFSPASSSPDITNSGDYIFRNWPSDIYEAKALADYLVKNNIKKIGILEVNNDFALGIVSKFQKYFVAQHGTIVYDETVDERKIDYRLTVEKIRKSKVDGIYLVGYAKEVALLMKSIKELGITAPLFSTSSAQNDLLLSMLGKYADGLIYSYPKYDVENINDSLQYKFGQKFIKEYKYTPTYNSATGYDAVKILMSAIDAVGNNASKIKDYLYNLKNYPGVSGVTTFDKNGDVIKEIGFKTIKNGKFIFLNK